LSQEENCPGGMYATAKLLEQYIANEVAKLAVNNYGVPEVIVNPTCPGQQLFQLPRD